MIIEERQSTHVYRQKQLFTKEELEAREHLCVHEQPAYCNAACPLKLDTKAMMAALAAGDFPYLFLLFKSLFLATLMGPSVIWLIQARLLPQP